MTDFFLLLMLAGAGDELQGMKRGIIEMLDGMAITKADGDNKRKAERARIEYAQCAAPLSRFRRRVDSAGDNLLCTQRQRESPRVWQMVLDHRQLLEEQRFPRATAQPAGAGVDE